MDFKIGQRVRNREGEEGVVTQVVPGEAWGAIEQAAGPAVAADETEYQVRRDDGTPFTATHSELTFVK